MGEGVGDSKTEGVPLLLPVELGVMEGLAPRDSDAVGEALRLELREPDVLGVGVGVPEAVPLPVLLPVRLLVPVGV